MGIITSCLIHFTTSTTFPGGFFGCTVGKTSCKSARSDTLLAFSERYSSTARTETDKLIRQLHRPSRGRHTGPGSDPGERERETRSVTRSLQTVVERRWENTSESPLEYWITWSCSRQDYVKKIFLKSTWATKQSCSREGFSTLHVWQVLKIYSNYSNEFQVSLLRSSPSVRPEKAGLIPLLSFSINWSENSWFVTMRQASRVLLCFSPGIIQSSSRYVRLWLPSTAWSNSGDCISSLHVFLLALPANTGSHMSGARTVVASQALMLLTEGVC